MASRNLTVSITGDAANAKLKLDRARLEARVAELEDILARASRLAESQQADMVQQVIQEAWATPSTERGGSDA